MLAEILNLFLQLLNLLFFLYPFYGRTNITA